MAERPVPRRARSEDHGQLVPTSVCILSAAWRRFDVTRLALEQRQRLCVELAAGGIQAHSLIVADDENLDIAAEFGSETLEVPNEPLGRKCSTGLRAAAQSADWVVWCGSDDWLHADTFRPLHNPPREDGRVPIHVGTKVAVVNLETGLLRRTSWDGRYGVAHWIIPSPLLLAPKHEPIQPFLKRGLDGALIRGIRLARIPFELEKWDPHDFRCVDFKTDDVSLTPYAGVTKHLGYGPEESAWEPLTEHYPADLVEKARATHLARAQASGS